jgi:excisionase family DNA binding protein
MEKLLLTVPEAAHLLGVGRSQMYAMLASGAVPRLRVGRSLRVPVADLALWVRRNVVPGAAQDSVRDRAAE